MNFTTLTLELQGAVALVTFNRPDKANALNADMWREMRQAFEWCDAEGAVRAVVLSGAGKHFSSGIDLSLLMGVQGQINDECEARKREKLRGLILDLQACVTSLEKCRKPVIAAISGYCLGGGLDIALAADFRYASVDAQFGVREVDIGMVADVGTLQRLPTIVGQGVAREMALTGRDIGAEQAERWQLVNRVLPDAEAVRAAALETAGLIAAKSPLAVRGSKQVLNYSRDHSVADGLEYVANWNAAMLLSEDIAKAGMAAMMKQPAQFRD
ncbi:MULTISPECIES: crotonase/enoyl-CoA hydratase family protein [unclassified Paludibacterium]|uniref:crotonase/enoyl-CoA hydratase family protein n=1 Tax=unclassified Paludibacterium TaxID=2618429 RepID=UPI001C047617|nr:crotonase/enoyl-CoA hydratase family protein [Paludibacterium sp. B53371]BEV71141.1 crotonase/enoyl-CoA hydratase family protein [Paludibacterium sp. THUN1379]